MNQTTGAKEFIVKRVRAVEGVINHLGWRTDKESLEIVTDLLTDLRHYARVHGIQGSTFRELVALSDARCRAEMAAAGEF